MNSRNVLITGASSPLGEYLIERLLSDYRIEKILAVCDEGYPLTLPESERLSIFQLKMRKQRKLHDLLFGPARESQVDVLIHASKVFSANREGIAVRRHNVETVRSILNFADRHPTIKRLIFCSGAEVYQVQRDLPSLMEEQHPLNMNSGAPQWIRDRVEVDVMACTRMGLSHLRIVVLRMAEILAPGCGSQFFDYLQTPVCFRPLGFDPMLNFLTLADASSAIQKAIHNKEQGVFNIPGADTLPLSRAIDRWGRIGIPVPNTVAHYLYTMRRVMRRGDFRYGMNRRRFHFTGILDGRRAADILRYIPSHPIEWPIEFGGEK